MTFGFIGTAASLALLSEHLPRLSRSSERFNAEPDAAPNSRQPRREAMRPGCRTSDCLPTFIVGRLSVSLSFGVEVHEQHRIQLPLLRTVD